MAIAELLTCVGCGAELLPAVPDDSWALRCGQCGRVFRNLGGVLDLADAGAATALDDIDYDAVYATDVDHSFGYFESLKALVRPVLDARQGTVVEVGSGTGYMSVPMVQGLAYDTLVLTDVSEKMLQVCRAKVAGRYGASPPGVHYLRMDGNAFTFRRGSIDLAFAHGVLHHILHYREFLAGLHASLRKGGVAVFIEPTFRHHAALLLVMTGFIDRFGSTLDPADLTKLTAYLQHLHVSVKLRREQAFLRELEDKHMFERQETLRVLADVGFHAARVVPTYGHQALGVKMRVYMQEMKVSEDGQHRVLDHLFGLQPLLQDVLADECFSPSDTYVFEKEARWTPQLAAREAPVGDLATPLLAGERPVVARRVTLTVDAATERGDGTLDLTGWAAGDLPIKAVRCGERTAYVKEGRMDVLAHLRQELAASSDNLLFSGFRLEGVRRAEPGTQLALQVQFADDLWSSPQQVALGQPAHAREPQAPSAEPRAGGPVGRASLRSLGGKLRRSLRDEGMRSTGKKVIGWLRHAALAPRARRP
ncbi:MAG: class I SAM-dependent methyltransferase [Myxococcaceae bacterium]|nr:class I SAM-dependent methyltransferase [Myxococcaceae bacterium]MCI0671683.1 class I SAM-dependent methyltransferase [Myxococcaceae bacterium]